MQQINVEKPNRNTSLLAPFFEKKVLDMLEDCKNNGLHLHVFEAHRSPERQNYLYSQGRTRDGKIVTNAKAWESWHQLSLAVDCVFKDALGAWTWEGDWEKAHKIFKEHGFETLSFEKPHIQITGGLSIEEAVKIAKGQGALALWSVVEQRLMK